MPGQKRKGHGTNSVCVVDVVTDALLVHGQLGQSVFSGAAPNTPTRRQRISLSSLSTVVRGAVDCGSPPADTKQPHTSTS